MVIKKYVASVMAGLMLLISVSSASAGSLLQQTEFENGVSLPWQLIESADRNASSKIVDGEYCVTMEYPGTEVWDVQIRHREVVLQKDHVYTASFMVRADKDCTIRAKIGDQGKPYDEESFMVVKLVGGAPAVKVVMPKAYDQSQLKSFESKADHPLAEFAIHMGGSYAASGISPGSPNNIYFDDFQLDDEAFVPTATPTPRPISDIKVNQLGYLPYAAKKATVKTDSNIPLAWKLKNSSGLVVASGTTALFGADKDSGDMVQIIDFSSYHTKGKGYTLWVDGSNLESNPFDIDTDIYSEMQKDALQFFYHQRSGTNIQMPYAVKTEWQRAAGHVDDTISLNGYTIKGTGGWYDAGLYSKSVLEGGNALWKMMNQFERSKVFGKNTYGTKDGQMNIPENSNGIPDLLDEAKWEMDFLVSMQAPSGLYKGMVHHKLISERWLLPGVRPDDDNEKRIVKNVSTIATLNLAALGAQAYRVFTDYDSDLASKYLAAAETAWDAAIVNPSIFYPTANQLAGCGYSDETYHDDDFYWAACELYAATGNDKYYDYIKNSKNYLNASEYYSSESAISFTDDTSNLGTISLLLTKDKITSHEKTIAIANISKVCNQWLDNIRSQGYGVPIKGDPASGFPMYSNAFITDIAMNLAYAYDFTGDAKYLNGCTESMDYIMGRNPLDQSYVTGYGEGAVKNPYHNFFAFQADNKFPKAPPGFLVSGPNSGCQDSWISGAGLKGGPAEKCYYDNIESWSSNCLYNNMNAPLAWLTAYLSEEQNIPENPLVYGDFNNDLSLNSADYTLLRRYLLGIITEPSDATWKKRMDVNGDSKVDSGDYTFINRKLLGKILKFPVEN